MKVFFAVDGSPESLAAVRQVGQLLSPMTASAVLCFAPPDVILRHASKAKEMHYQALKSITDAVLAEAVRFLPDSFAKGAAKITTPYTPRDGIVAEANNLDADLIVVGARGMSGLAGLLLGSVSQAVVHQSKKPVLVSRSAVQRAPGQPLRVLFADDGSESSRAALEEAQHLSYPAGTEVIAVTVVDAPPAELPDWVTQHSRSPEMEAVIERWRQGMEDDRRHAEERLRTLMCEQVPPFSRAEIVVAQGHSAEQILKLAEARRVDLIVIGSGGKGPLSRFFLGSTSQKVLTHAACSVLVARANG